MGEQAFQVEILFGECRIFSREAHVVWFGCGLGSVQRICGKSLWEGKLGPDCTEAEELG